MSTQRAKPGQAPSPPTICAVSAASYSRTLTKRGCKNSFQHWLPSIAMASLHLMLPMWWTRARCVMACSMLLSPSGGACGDWR